MGSFIFRKILFKHIWKITKVPQFLQILIHGVKLLYLFPLVLKSAINFQSQIRYFIHSSVQLLQPTIDKTDIIFHLPHSVDGRYKLAIVFEDERLYLMILRFDLFFNLVVLADQLLDRVLLQHAQNVSLGVEVLTV